MDYSGSRGGGEKGCVIEVESSGFYGFGDKGKRVIKENFWDFSLSIWVKGGVCI